MPPWPCRVTRAPFLCSIARPWRRSSCPWGESRAMSPWPARRSANRPTGLATRCSSSTSMSSVLRRRRTSPDALRYEPGFSVDLLADLALPIGEYDSDQPLNIGQNRWYGRLGDAHHLAARSVGAGPAHDPGIPARRVAVRRQQRLCREDAGDRSIVPVGRALDARLHRALLGLARRRLVHGGKATIDGVPGEKLDNLGSDSPSAT